MNYANFEGINDIDDCYGLFFFNEGRPDGHGKICTKVENQGNKRFGQKMILPSARCQRGFTGRQTNKTN